MNKKFDYLIVGSGLFGAVFAHEAFKRGKKVKVIDKRNHLGGNIYCQNIDGIQVHKYGAHIFHTNDENIWKYVNQFVPFNSYINSPLAFAKGKLYNLPFNMNTFYQLWGLFNPKDVEVKLSEEINKCGIIDPKNLEEQALSLVGKDIYETLIKEYTEKQWGKPATELPSFIIKRLPVRFTFDNNYFNDRFQGIPVGGYNRLIDALLDGIDTEKGIDYLKNRIHLNSIAHKIVYCGKIDEYFDYEFGHLAYRSLRFETEILNTQNFQGNAVINYNDKDVPFTRIIEHKHFEFGTQSHTVITREYPQNWDLSKEAYYPINDEHNQSLYKRYRLKADNLQNVIFGGRLAEYRYYDMHQIIASSLKAVKLEFEK